MRWNSSEIGSCTGTPHFNKGAKAVQWKRVVFFCLFVFYGAGTIVSTWKKENCDSYPTPYTKINLKLIIDLNVKRITIKSLEEYIGDNLCDPRLGKYFLNKHQQHNP